MSDTVITVENLSKKYIIKHQQERYTALRDVITNKIKTLGKRELVSNIKEDFWALNDISFDIKQGERIGIIGRNGAGKSTLLKILSRITEPATGRVTINGRVASLLEVGTGFHPELTGRENIFLNGAILGMSKQEIKKKFDEIVDFAEVEKFLDTPVKRYSSGMYVRLAFSVAAHLEPEILIVDEVLAVGDAQFQKKCLGKMSEIGNTGRTLLVVSHQMPMIQQLCDRCILLEKGLLKQFGSTTEVIAQYMSTGAQGVTRIISEDDPIFSLGKPYYTVSKISLVDNEGSEIPNVIDTSYTGLKFIIEGFIDKPDRLLNIGFMLFDDMNNLLMYSYQTDQQEENWPKLEKGEFTLEAKIDISMLNEGRYRIGLLSTIHSVKMLHDVQNTAWVDFEIIGNRGNSPYWVGKKNSVLAPFIPWKQI